MERKSILLNANESSLSPNRLECTVCKERFWMTSKYMDHMSTHQHLLLSCNICNKGFYSQKLLDAHYLSHNDVINTYDCNMCPRKFLQKFQLEQHVQHHLLSSSNQFVECEKKRVRFSNILESRHISEDEFSSDDCNLDEDKITTTRCGRVVKPKKIFENEEHEVKHDSVVICDKEPDTTINLLQAPVAVDNIKQSPKIILNKTLRVVVERLPFHLYEKYIQKENVSTPAVVKKNPLDDVKSNLNKFETKYSEDLFLKKYGAVKIENTASQSAVIISDKTQLNKSSFKKAVINPNSPSAVAVSDKSQLNLQNKFPVKFNDAGNVVSESAAVTHQEKAQPIKHFKGIFPVLPTKTVLTSDKAEFNDKKLGVSKIMQNTVIFGKPNLNAEIKLSSKKSNICNLKSISQAPNSIRSLSSFPPISQVEKQFLYVGPKQALEKVKTIIEEMKKTPDQTANLDNKMGSSIAEINKANLQPNLSKSSSIASKSLNFGTPSTSSENFNVSSSVHKAALKRPASSCALSISPAKYPKNEDGVDALKGVLGKKVVDDILFIKVTPEFMKDMQKKTSSLDMGDKLKEATTNVTSPAFSTTKNPDISQTVGMLNERKGMKMLRTNIESNNKQSKMSPSKTNTTSISNVYVNKTHMCKNPVQQIKGSISDNAKLNLSGGTKVSYLDASKTYGKGCVQLNTSTAGGNLSDEIPTDTQASNLDVVKTVFKEDAVANKRCTDDKNLNSGKMTSVGEKSNFSNDVQTTAKRCVVKPNKDLCDKNSSNKMLGRTEASSGSNLNVQTSVSHLYKSPTSAKNASVNRSGELHVSDMSEIKLTERILERYKAKIEEKERKKREKYESKKRLRYMESQVIRKYPHLSVSVVEVSEKLKLTDSVNISSKNASQNQTSSVSVEHKEIAVEENDNTCQPLGRRKARKSFIQPKSKKILKSAAASESLSNPDCNMTHPSSGHTSENQITCSDSNSTSAKDYLNPCLLSTEKAEELYSKFEKNLSEVECLAYLNELDNLITSFNLRKKSDLIFKILRFCRQHESYDVKERAIALHRNFANSIASAASC